MSERADMWVALASANARIAVLEAALRALLDACQRNQEHYSEEAQDIAEADAREALAQPKDETK